MMGPEKGFVRARHWQARMWGVPAMKPFCLDVAWLARGGNKGLGDFLRRLRIIWCRKAGDDLGCLLGISSSHKADRGRMASVSVGVFFGQISIIRVPNQSTNSTFSKPCVRISAECPYRLSFPFSPTKFSTQRSFCSKDSIRTR